MGKSCGCDIEVLGRHEFHGLTRIETGARMNCRTGIAPVSDFLNGDRLEVLSYGAAS
jgi:hypothetical protein